MTSLKTSPRICKLKHAFKINHLSTNKHTNSLDKYQIQMTKKKNLLNPSIQQIIGRIPQQQPVYHKLVKLRKKHKKIVNSSIILPNLYESLLSHYTYLSIRKSNRQNKIPINISKQNMIPQSSQNYDTRQIFQITNKQKYLERYRQRCFKQITLFNFRQTSQLIQQQYQSTQLKFKPILQHPQKQSSIPKFLTKWIRDPLRRSVHRFSNFAE